MQRIACLFILIVFTLVVVRCAPTAEKEIPFTVVTTGHTVADYPNQEGIVITSMDEWEAMWEKLHRFTTPRPELPDVDFAQHILLAVFAGEKRSGGYAIQVERVTQTDEIVMVYASEISPGPEEITIAQITFPYQIVKISHTNLPVRFDF